MRSSRVALPIGLAAVLLAEIYLGLAGGDHLSLPALPTLWLRLVLIGLAVALAVWIAVRRPASGAEDGEVGARAMTWWPWPLISLLYLVLLAAALARAELGLARGAVLALFGLAAIQVFRRWLEDGGRVGIDSRTAGVGGGVAGWTLSPGLVRLVLLGLLALSMTLIVAGDSTSDGTPTGSAVTAGEAPAPATGGN